MLCQVSDTELWQQRILPYAASLISMFESVLTYDCLEIIVSKLPLNACNRQHALPELQSCRWCTPFRTEVRYVFYVLSQGQKKVV